VTTLSSRRQMVKRLEGLQKWGLWFLDTFSGLFCLICGGWKLIPKNSEKKWDIIQQILLMLSQASIIAKVEMWYTLCQQEIQEEIVALASEDEDTNVDNITDSNT
jgi:hypothetical protein